LVAETDIDQFLKQPDKYLLISMQVCKMFVWI
jgi:hypothetical protein